MADKMQELIQRRPCGEFPVTLPDQAFEEFWERGFTSVPRVTSDEEIEWLREIYDLFFSDEMQWPKGAFVRDAHHPLAHQRHEKVISQLLFPESLYPQLRETIFYRNTQLLAKKLLGGGDLVCWGHMLRKAPGAMDWTPWHQDEAYWDPNFDRDAAACWLPLEDASLENGAMSFIPGSHKGPVLEHGFPFDDPSVTALKLKHDIMPETAVSQPIPAGGVSIHHHRVVHSSGPNRTEKPRRAYVNVWNSGTVQRLVPHERPWYWQKKEARDAYHKEKKYFHDSSFADVTRSKTVKTAH